jgi:hypothetical protein
MVKIRNIKEIENNDTVELFDNKGNSLGTIETGIQLQDVCVQIKELQLEGYYVIYQNTKISITKEGRVYCQTKRPFSANGDLLRKLI